MRLFFSLLLFSQAIAQEPSETDEQPDSPATEEADHEKKKTNEVSEKKDALTSSEEIIVYGQREVDRRRKILDQNLQNNGYRDGKRRGDKVIYRPETVWKPSVHVYDSGWVDLKKTPPRFEPWIKGHADNKWRYLSCIPPFTPMCIRASGWLISKRRAQHSKTEVIDQHVGDIQFWQEAVVGAGTRQRLEVNLPDQLDMIWASDRSYTEKRQEIISLWATRTCTQEGDAAAEVIGAFIEYEIQESQHPLTPEEIKSAKEQASCEREFPLKIP